MTLIRQLRFITLAVALVALATNVRAAIIPVTDWVVHNTNGRQNTKHDAQKRFIFREGYTEVILTRFPSLYIKMPNPTDTPSSHNIPGIKQKSHTAVWQPIVRSEYLNRFSPG